MFPTLYLVALTFLTLCANAQPQSQDAHIHTELGTGSLSSPGRITLPVRRRVSTTDAAQLLRLGIVDGRRAEALTSDAVSPRGISSILAKDRLVQYVTTVSLHLPFL